MNFSDLQLHPYILEGLEALNYTTATPIQEQAIPLILEGKDVIGAAQTGTGKTAAFILPIIHKIINSGEGNYTQCLVMVPTRELAMQIDQAVEAYSYYTGVSSIAIYGGNDGKAFTQEKTALTSGADILIATPGRLMAHMKLGYVNFSKLHHLVLDEADRMLDMGFLPDLQSIIATLNPNRQNLLFSATMAPNLMKLAKSMMREPVTIKVAIAKPAENITQSAYKVPDELKIPLISHLLATGNTKKIIVFCSTKQAVTALYRKLYDMKLKVAQISSDLEQAEREQTMIDYRNGLIHVLVATDVLSRGVDIDGIDLVINFDVPREPADYVHRIGRTARAAALGEAITLVNAMDYPKFKKIEELIGNTSIRKAPLPPEIETLLAKLPTKSDKSKVEQPNNRHHSRNHASSDKKKYNKK